MPLRDRPIHYHIYGDPNLDTKFVGVKAFDSVLIPQAPLTFNGQQLKPGGPQPMYSLKLDLAGLRNDGASKKINSKPIVDQNFDSVPGFLTEEGRTILAIKLGGCGTFGQDHKVLITGGHHANEWSGVEMAYLLGEYLVTTFDQDAGDPKDPSKPTPQELLQLAIRHILTNREIIIVPMVNPDGHNFSVLTNREWRKNRKQFTGAAGVDLNRNYPGNFGTVPGGSSDDPTDDRFRGFSEKSEIETRAMVKIIEDNKDKLKAALDYHNCGQQFLALGDNQDGATDVFRFVKFGMFRLLSERPGVPYNRTDFATRTDHRVDGDMLQFFRLKTTNRPSFGVELPPQATPVPGGTPVPIPKEEGFSGFPESKLLETFIQNIGPALALINCGGLDDIPHRTLVPGPIDPIGQLEVTRNCARRFSRDQGFDPFPP
jgi:hypothetical protein